MTGLETRAAPDDAKSLMLTGYAAKFNERSALLFGEFYELIAPGAFARSLAETTVKALWNHNFDLVLGSTKSGTLRLEEDDVGLRMEIDLPDNEWGRFAYDAVRRGDVDGVSFGFYVQDAEWIYLPDEGVHLRTLLDVDLFEISPTGFPAYTDSEVEARSVMEAAGLMTKQARQAEMRKLLCDIHLMEV
ncbi:hypothetical protein SAMN05880570_0495 [Paenibacillus sp. RU4T]|nr:hypothetical protein SAMN05880555_0496 [Paenibacillus sp. RU4X]SIQ26257.1 hypothetical protein SAMN05880570_0495 [Paenibacillus sp. RU4T]